jgi:hypothetical protein
MVLIGAGVLCPAQEDVVIAKTKKQTDQLNHYLCHKARGSNELTCLANPVTGGGVVVPRFLQLFLLAKAQGNTQPEQWAQFVWSILAMQNQCVIKDGITLESDSENLTELVIQAYAFANKQLPIYRIRYLFLNCIQFKSIGRAKIARLKNRYFPS